MVFDYYVKSNEILGTHTQIFLLPLNPICVTINQKSSTQEHS